MASTFNAFESLLGASEQAPNTKKRAKPRNKAAAPRPDVPVDPSPSPAQNGVKEAQPADRAAADDVYAADAIAKLEVAARTAVSSQDRARLWGSWCRQAGDVKSVQTCYQDQTTGETLSFKQVFMRSKALEITAELAVSLPAGQQVEDQLQKLLAAFLPVSSRQNGHLAAALSKLAQLLADGAPDSFGAAQRAAVSVIKHLKGSSEAASSGFDSHHASEWLQQLKKLDAGINSQLTLLHKLGQASSAAVTKERVQCAVKLLKLQEEKVQLLQPESVPSVQSHVGATSPALVALQELQSVVYNHLQEAEGLEASARSHAAYAQVQLAQSQSAAAREEVVLGKQAAELAAQMVSLEAQLQALKLQASEVEQRRAQLKKQVASSLGNGSSGGHVEVAKGSTDYKQQLAAVEVLLDLVDPNRHGAVTVEQVWEVQAGQPTAVSEYISFAQQCLNLNLSLLADIPQKINFSKQRISQACKLLVLTAANSKSQDMNKKQKEDAEKLLADTMRMVEAIMVQGEDALKGVVAWHRTLAAQEPEFAASLIPQVAVAEELYHKLGQQYTSLMTCYDQAPIKVSAPRAPRERRAAETAPSRLTPDLAAPPPSAAARAPAAAAAPASLRPVDPITSASIRQWARPQPAAVSTEEDTSLPTPAEAFRAPEMSDGFHTVGGGRKQRSKA